MEANTRSFEPVRVDITNVEMGSDRFSRDHINTTPGIAFWRVNLTALSQKHNLYFVATRGRIQVYKPEFPYQKLGDKPALSIVPHLQNPKAKGYIEPAWPHHINHLIVGDLGDQEILLASTDSGNVVAYYTSSINLAAKKDAYRFSSDGNADFVGVRPFFSHWVYESAWGLAIHKQARMIAVSANTPFHVEDGDDCSKITVFAFALTAPTEDDLNNPDTTDQVDEETANPSEWKLWTPIAYQDSPKRNCNYKTVLAGPKGHDNNVPCITFVNGPEDVDGTWLLSTDIHGYMKLWHIWTGKCYKTWNFSSQSSTAIPWTAGRESGWIAAALDIHAFRPAISNAEFFGFDNARPHYGHHARGTSFDLTDLVRSMTPLTSSVHPLARQIDGYSSGEEEELDVLTTEVIDSDDGSDTPKLDHIPISSHATDVPCTQANTLQASAAVDRNLGATLVGEANGNETANDPDDADEYDEYEEAEIFTDSDEFEEGGMEIEITGELSDEVDEEDEEGDMLQSDNVESSTGSPSTDTTASSDGQARSVEFEAVDTDLDNIDSQVLSSSISIDGKGRRSLKRRLDTTEPTRETEHPHVPRIPIIHCSTSHVRLIADPSANFPHFFCARILRQTLPARLEATQLSVLDRINMMHQIPELGIVLIATQIGRCAVCSLTRRVKDGLLGFRVDWILPTKKQERAQYRPASHALLGIAASPVQGHVRSPPGPLTSYDYADKWSTDRVINGTLTTFDPEVVQLQRSGTTAARNNNQPGQGRSRTGFHSEYRVWQKPEKAERWQAHENSRRYRLMLTYTDMTVLTYELSRGVEHGDIRAEYINR